MPEPIEAANVVTIVATALSYVKESKGDVQDNVENLLKKLGTDLDDVGYQPSEDVEEAYRALEASMDEVDTEAEQEEDNEEIEEDNEEDLDEED